MYLTSNISNLLKLYKVKFTFLLCIVFICTSYAQDLHFSQYFANPISYNPANTGFFNGSYRLGVNHKQQWPWAIDGRFLNYNSSAAYVDFSMLDKKLNKLDWVGMGFNFINDQAGDGNLTANKAYISMAYHKGLDKKHKHFLSIGFTLGFVNRTIDFGALYFNNQWIDRVGFDLTLPNDEGYVKERTGYLDFGMGLQGKHQISDKFNYTYGLSFLHLNQPTESFYNQDNKLGMRTLFQTGIEYQIVPRFDVQASMYFTHQKKATELLFGALGGYKANKDPKGNTTKLFIGAFYRLQDAISPIVGVQYNRTRLLVNYDINLSSLSKASRGNGGFEISLVQIGITKKKKNQKTKTFCPSF